LGKPAARIGDQHVCPKVTLGTPATPHVGGPVSGGCLTVLIDGLPAAREGDSCFCFGEPDMIKTGSTGVYIGGKPAARVGDQTEHGGVIVAGSRTVMIGEKKVPRVLKKPELKIEEVKELSPEEKITAINEAIEMSIVLLERKLQLLEQNDCDTLVAFKNWFGKDDEKSRGVILERIRRALEVSKRLRVENFNSINNLTKNQKAYGLVYSWDRKHSILLGDKFWTKKGNDTVLKAGVIIHELSHFRDIGKTDDFTYGEKGCLELAKHYPEEGMFNADSFEIFIRG
jgi:uncharacterized Zn-binding protein involved in type VI secretion